MKIFKLKLLTLSLSCAALFGQITQVEDMSKAEVPDSGLLAVDIDDTILTKDDKSFYLLPGAQEVLGGSPRSIGVTARRPNQRKITQRILTGLGLKFQPPVFEGKTEFAVFDGLLTPKLVSYFDEEGVLYCGSCPKGKALEALYERTKSRFPASVTAFDDKMDNLQSIKISCEGKGARFTGFHVQSPDAKKIRSS